MVSAFKLSHASGYTKAKKRGIQLSALRWNHNITDLWAECNSDSNIRFNHAVHPLLDQARPLSICLEGKGAFISGQNGIGKSTLLRAMGINLIAARAFGFCYAHDAKVPFCLVYSSIQNEDSLVGGESLYIAELRRAKELLAASKDGQKCVYIIDEVFRGTNYLESVSVAAAVLHTLTKNGLVIVSSHNLIFAPLLKACLIPFCVTAPDGDRRRLLLLPGTLANPNGIALLSEKNFGEQIESKANLVFKWLNEYLTPP